MLARWLAPGRQEAWRLLAGLNLVLVIAISGLPFPLAARITPALASAAARLACVQRQGRIVRAAVTSEVYDAPVPFMIYLPPCYDRMDDALPVIYLLHGGASDETQWPDLRVQAAADELITQGTPPFVVVMPGGLYYPNVNYEAFMLGEVLPQVEHRFRVAADGSGRAIGGISLGGYWALRIAFHHPRDF
ncbi:MAG: hypothetical protein HY260_11585, partial [Chloroflexi bacterium]|nr:hypothetical protein [Chloroflexota bacterium]